MKKAKKISCVISLLIMLLILSSLNINASYNGFIGHCPGYFYEYTISGYVISAADYSLSGDVAIPSEINGIPVEAISSFSACENIKSITIPASVKYTVKLFIWVLKLCTEQNGMTLSPMV